MNQVIKDSMMTKEYFFLATRAFTLALVICAAVNNRDIMHQLYQQIFTVFAQRQVPFFLSLNEYCGGKNEEHI